MNSVLLLFGIAIGYAFAALWVLGTGDDPPGQLHRESERFIIGQQLLRFAYGWAVGGVLWTVFV